MFLQQLALLKGFDLGALDPDGGEFVHLLIECAKFAFADREAFYGDPTFAAVPMETLLTDTYNDYRRKLIGDRLIGSAARLAPGLHSGLNRDADTCGLDATPVAPGGGEPTLASGRCAADTCTSTSSTGQHGQRDPEGRLVSVFAGDSGARVPLGSRGQMFWLADGLPTA